MSGSRLHRPPANRAVIVFARHGCHDGHAGPRVLRRRPSDRAHECVKDARFESPNPRPVGERGRANGFPARCEHRIADLERPPEGRRFGHPAELVPLPSQLGGKERLEARALARELRARLRLPRQRSGECRLGGVEPGPDGGVRRGQDPGVRVNAPFRGQQVCPHLSIGNRGNSVVERVDQRRGSLLDGGGHRQQTRRGFGQRGRGEPLERLDRPRRDTKERMVEQARSGLLGVTGTRFPVDDPSGNLHEREAIVPRPRRAPSMARIRLRPDVALRVANLDRTFFGSPIGTRPDEQTRQLFGRVVRHAEEQGVGDLAGTSPATLAQDVADRAFADVAERDARGGWRVRSEVLYPDASRAGLHTLHVDRPDTNDGVQARLPALLWPRVHDLIAALSSEGHDERSSLGAEVHQLIAALRSKDLIIEGADGSEPGSFADLPEITFAGHNTVVVRSKTTGVVLDPFLRERRMSYPESYQPLTRPQLGPIDAILLTHSHPDHFDPGSLLRFRRDVRVIVPALERETVLSVDMALRLQQLGFERVTAMKWGDRLRVGDVDIAALPFHGEQPAEHEVLHPEVRNAGNTYVVRTPTLSCAFVADSGRDPSGDVKDVARDWVAREGSVDFVFSGYRGWELYPAQLLFSSVSRFLLFVPPSLWGTRQRLMNNIDDAIDVAEGWGARYLVPYADGGAPWYWDIGLGPVLDGTGRENVTFDPFPERVVEAAAQRGQTHSGTFIRSPVEVLLLRPGESLTFANAAPRAVRSAGHEWPYGDANR